VYSTLRSLLKNSFFTDKIGDRKHVILEMLHSCSPPANKESVLKSFRDTNGTIRILVATIAFGMGVDCKGVHRTVHFGPPKNIESFVQETGRAGRDGAQSISYLLYHGLLLTHVEKDIKDFIKLKDCRRKWLLKHFIDTDDTESVVSHLCCDNCSQSCTCGSPDCDKDSIAPSVFHCKEMLPGKERVVTKQQKDNIKESLTVYHKSLVIELVGEHAHGDIKSLTTLPLLIGFSDMQISQVQDNCTKLFTVDDIYNCVEIWDKKHAIKIQDVLNEVFDDVLTAVDKPIETDNEDADEDELHDLPLYEWNTIIEDDDFLDLILENLDVTELRSVDESSDMSIDTSHIDVPNAALDVLKKISFEDA